jgi:hypothetical protein
MRLVMATVAEIENKLVTHEAICAERYATFIQRVDRLERILIGAAGVLIVGMAGIIMSILLKGV